MLKVFGESVQITEEMECMRGGDHRKLIADARVDYLNRSVLPDDKYGLCGRCGKAISLRI